LSTSVIVKSNESFVNSHLARSFAAPTPGSSNARTVTKLSFCSNPYRVIGVQVICDEIILDVGADVAITCC
jgi:hypothetical protein